MLSVAPSVSSKPACQHVRYTDPSELTSRATPLASHEAKQVALSKVDSWKRPDEFPKEFVTLPGELRPNSALADACYTLLLAPKSASLK